MAVPKGKQRITITVSDESVEKLSYYGEKMGMNRSALCAYLVGQGLMGLDRANSMFDKVSESMSEEIKRAFASMADKSATRHAEVGS